MRYFFKKNIFLEASACSVSIATQNHSWNCDIFDDDVYDDDEKINALKQLCNGLSPSCGEGIASQYILHMAEALSQYPKKN